MDVVSRKRNYQEIINYSFCSDLKNNLLSSQVNKGKISISSIKMNDYYTYKMTMEQISYLICIVIIHLMNEQMRNKMNLYSVNNVDVYCYLYSREKKMY